MADARCLTFHQASARPLLTALPAPYRTAPGTTVRIRLRKDPYEAEGIPRHTDDERLIQLVRRLVLENAVPIRAWEPGAAQPETLQPFTLADGTPEDVFDRLYPSLADT
ncbi:hypothetical protein [Streptomyces sp. NPDC048419]|uniref:hypothetical protein n=1 Tax=Streptomyces sp. NPDC048419 TaxID=3365547 RepID=UPI00371DEF43